MSNCQVCFGVLVLSVIFYIQMYHFLTCPNCIQLKKVLIANLTKVWKHRKRGITILVREIELTCMS